MRRFEIALPARNAAVLVDSAEKAYAWLDDNAKVDEPYLISAVAPGGRRQPIESDTYPPPATVPGRPGRPARRATA